MRNAECGLGGMSLLAAAALFLFVAGCGDGRTPVRGTVSFDGAPVETGTISFVPTDTSLASDAGEIRDGEFSFPVMPGAKKVSISASRPAQDVDPNDPNAAGLREDFIPSRFNTQTELTAEIAADGPPLVFDLQSQP